ncbi:hypothetical protein PFBG_06145, partial [Plasmodium falciparum 7G8]
LYDNMVFLTSTHTSNSTTSSNLLPIPGLASTYYIVLPPCFPPQQWCCTKVQGSRAVSLA